MSEETDVEAQPYDDTEEETAIVPQPVKIKWVKRFKLVDIDGTEIPYESRKCTNKGKVMDDVWISQVPHSTLEELSELVSLGLETESNIVARYKQGAAIEAQHKAKESLSGKLTKTVRDDIMNNLTDDELENWMTSKDRAQALDTIINKHWLEHNQPLT